MASRSLLDHPVGLFHVHPHQQGLSADQVFGGLGAALVVRGDLDRIAEVAAASETLLLLKDFASAAGTGDAGMGWQVGAWGSSSVANPSIPIALTPGCGWAARRTGCLSTTT
jgi:hypothetical protein